eukprot:gnl/TRDRNA2_/TRDRNA2_135273_c0_seq1.p1 gnl/TRDRNA2_/TRDRNA2_135273_c0~~gnl/TRDRNA2_/TRDRNA2_135273_c0_seq1.p1  ORF type:complete len:477 (-),score=42.64 gnl/TRDRNA2_/TRDRNA2_135273_c0_seq1:114-1454(-)
MVPFRKCMSCTTIVFSLILISCMYEQGGALHLSQGALHLSQQQTCKIPSETADSRLHFVWRTNSTEADGSVTNQLLIRRAHARTTSKTIMAGSIPVHVHNANGIFGGLTFVVESIFKDLDAETTHKLNNCGLGSAGDATMENNDDVHVWVIVNGEDPTGKQFANEAIEKIGSKDRVLILGNLWNHSSKDDIVRDGRITSMWVPFASTSFAERRRHTPMDLYDRSRVNFDRERKGILAYMHNNGCGQFSIRERTFYSLDDELRTANQMPGSALATCGWRHRDVNGYKNEEGVNCDENCEDRDKAVGRYEDFRFVLAMEHGPSAHEHGYITEKMVNAFLAGAIPISDSTAARAQFFNTDSYIAVNTTKKAEGEYEDSEEEEAKASKDAAKVMMELLRDPQKWDRIRRQPSISEQSLVKYFSWHPAVWKSHGDFLKRQILNETLRLCLM